jgi:hypothetical protein
MGMSSKFGFSLLFFCRSLADPYAVCPNTDCVLGVLGRESISGLVSFTAVMVRRSYET